METAGDNSNEPIFSKTEKYEVRSGTINLGYDYEYKTVTLVSLRCLWRFKDFDDVWIAFNATSVGAMDDVVVIAQKKGDNGKIHKVKIMIQLKHKEKGTDIVESQFLDTKSNGTYSLLKYYKDIIKLKERLASKEESTPTILKHLGTVDDNTYFVLFTNKNTSKQTFLESGGCDLISFLNTSGVNSENLYSIDLAKVSTISSLPNPIYNINFNLFAKQSNANHLGEIIETEMEKIFRHFELGEEVNIENNSEKIVKYVTSWAMGKLGGHYFLTKKDVLYKLTELLLSQFELDLSYEEFNHYDCPQKLIWNKVVKCNPVTIVDSSEEIIKFLKLYIGSEVWPYIRNKKKWRYKLSTKEKTLFYEQHSNLKKAMLKVVGNFGKITALSIYKCLWFSEQLPLLLRVKTIEDYNAILKILKLCNFNLKVIIINETNSKLTTGQDVPVPFVTLFDLSHENKQEILKCSVKLQGRSSIVLNELVEDSFLEHFHCSAIINILLGNYNIGVEFEPLSKYFINRTLLRVFLKMDVLEKVSKEFFLLEINDEIGERSKKDKLGMLISVYKAKSNIIVSDGNVLKQIKELKTEEKLIHRLIVHDKNMLEWKESYGSTSNIKKYQFTHRNDFKKYVSEIGGSINDTSWICNEIESILANNISSGLFNNVKLISASPGMGKSTILDYMALKASTKMWVLNVDLIDHDDHYGKTEALTAQDHLNYFYATGLRNCSCNNTKLAEAVFQNFVNKKKVLVMLDGFDEVAISRKDQVMVMANCLRQAGFSVLVTTRPHLVSDLEEKFGTIAITLKPFSVDDQKNFLKQYFEHISDNQQQDQSNNKQNLIKNFVEKLLKASSNNLNDSRGEFMGIPLQTKLLADAFSNELKYSLEEGAVQFDSTFDLLGLYEKFINAKDVILRNKLGVAAINMQKLLRKQQQLFALKTLFPNPLLFRLDIEVKLKKFHKNNEVHIQNLQQDGLTIIQHNVTEAEPKLQVNFLHRTFAEYMAACWLKRKMNSKRENSRWTAKILIQRGLQQYSYNKFLFRMFDSMLAKDRPLQMLIINGRLNEATELVTSNPEAVGVVDEGGRTFLHLIALYGSYTWNLDFIESCKEAVVKDNFGYRPLDYAILSRSLDIANKLSIISKEISVAVSEYELESDLKSQRSYALMKPLLSFVICQQLLGEPISEYRNGLLPHYYSSWIASGHTKTDDYSRNDRTKTVSQLLIEMDISSAGKPYYYRDLHFAAAFGTPRNVMDLITFKDGSIRKHNFNNICTPLCCAVKHNRLETVKILLCNGENVDEPCMHENYHTALHCASKMGCRDIARELLFHQADVDVQDEYGNTALILALEYKHVDVAKLLLSNRAKANVKNSSNIFPIYHAVRAGWDDIIPALSKGVDINYSYSNRNTLIHIAILNKRVTTAHLLLRNGVSCNVPNKDGDLPLHTAAKEGVHVLLPEVLSKTINTDCSRSSVDVRNKQLQSPLHLSLTYDKRKNFDMATVTFLLSNGADTNVQDIDGNTALHYLCGKCPLGIKDRKYFIKLLLAAGANVDVKNNHGKTSIQFFLQENSGDHLPILPVLLCRTVQISSQDIHGNTALHYLCKECSFNIQDREHAINLLLSAGADVNSKNNNEKSSIHLFLAHILSEDNSRDYHKILSILLTKQAQVNIQDSEGNTALHYLCIDKRIQKEDRKSVAKLLLHRGADINSKNVDHEPPLHLFIQHNLREVSEVITFLLEKGASVKIQNINGESALHHLFRNNKIGPEDRKSAATKLFNKQADVNLRNSNDQTPLYVFLQNNFRNVSSTVGFLLDNGASALTQDNYGNTALHYLFCNDRIDAENRISAANLIIINKGADINLKNKSGKSPLRLYMETSVKDLTEIVPFLLNSEADINTQDNVGSTPLHHLCTCKAFYTRDRKTAVEFLLNNCAVVNIRNKSGRTPLHLYILHLHAKINSRDLSEVIPLLLNKQADVNIQDNKGNTALHYLCCNERADREVRQNAVELLLTNHADVNLKNNNDETVLHCLLQCLPSQDNKSNHFETFRLLLSRKAQVDVQDKDGNTPLHYLCREWTLNTEERISIAELLLINLTDINLKNNAGETPLHYYMKFLFNEANSRDLCEFVPLLLNKGADVNMKNSDGNTVLNCLCIDERLSEEVRRNAAQLLLVKGPMLT